MNSLALVVVVLVLTLVDESASLTCAKCNRGPCPSLPYYCYPTRTPCGCCDVCAGWIGDECSAFSPRCTPGLVCVNKRGEKKEVVEWYEISFGKGRCRLPYRRPHRYDDDSHDD
ncbi:hypothetical protein SNE40_004053 [Patella caerulea]|uniref:IGFBP N-terminal domain-containing protein n=1 Tax=Patella caerulea TaxID=87958 RepID=A0AAN8KI29_PATCE